MTNGPPDEGDDAPRSPDAGQLDGDSHATDVLLESMADRRARYALSHLDSASVDVIELDDLTDGVAEREAEAGVATVGEERRRRVAIDLHHNHLPKFDEAGLVDYDPRSKTVRFRGDDRIATCLELFEAVDRT